MRNVLSLVGRAKLRRRERQRHRTRRRLRDGRVHAELHCSDARWALQGLQ